ncbi:MAG: hypothetical protein QXL94_01995 [Candidatus Parvarchaeum sp.]
MAKSREHWDRLGGYLLGGEREVIINATPLFIEVEMPELGLLVRSMFWEDAYWRMLFEFERRLRERKEFQEELWVELRRINKV